MSTPPFTHERIAVRDIWRFLRRNLLMIGVPAILVLAASIGWALSQHKIWRASVTFVSNEKEMSAGGLASLAGQFGAVASLAGINVPTGDSIDEALEVLRSRAFTAEFIKRENLMPILFAEKWDAQQGAWRVKNPTEIPTAGAAYKLFDKEIRSINQDKRTGVVTLSVEWRDRALAARWANLLVDLANEQIRARAIREASRNAEFLNQEMNKAQVVELRQSISKLLESQINTEMLATVRKDYAFRVIDPAVVPDVREAVRPHRSLIAVLGLLVGMILGVVIALIREGIAVSRKEDAAGEAAPARV